MKFVYGGGKNSVSRYSGYREILVSPTKGRRNQDFPVYFQRFPGPFPKISRCRYIFKNFPVHFLKFPGQFLKISRSRSISENFPVHFCKFPGPKLISENFPVNF